MPEENQSQRNISRASIFWEIISRPSVIAPPTATTLTALGLGVAGVLTAPMSAVLCGIGVVYFAGMTVSYMFDEQAVKNIIRQIKENQKAAMAEVNEERMIAITNASDTPTANLLVEINTLFKAFDEEARNTDGWLLPMIEDVRLETADLRRKAFNIADFKSRIVKLLRNVNIGALEREVERLRRRIGKSASSPLLPALKSTEQEIQSALKLRDHNDALFAQINNIKSAIHQTHFGVIKLKTDATLAESGSSDIETQTQELKRKLEVVTAASKKVMDLDLS
jgi:hypothetical protein